MACVCAQALPIVISRMLPGCAGEACAMALNMYRPTGTTAASTTPVQASHTHMDSSSKQQMVPGMHACGGEDSHF